MKNPLNEYLLIISPEENISKKLSQIKHEFRNNYGCKYAAQLKPHCTLMHFFQLQYRENYLVKIFDLSAACLAAIKIRLNGFGRYPAHTIFIDIEDDKKIKKMAEALRSKFKSISGIKLFDPFYLSDPHVTIARDMTDMQFDLAWKEWGKRKFDFTFNVHSIRLLKRQISEKDHKPIENYRIVKDFELGGKEAKGEQFTLF